MLYQTVDFNGRPDWEQADKNKEKSKQENQNSRIKNNPDPQQNQNRALDAEIPKNTADGMFYFFQEVYFFHKTTDYKSFTDIQMLRIFILSVYLYPICNL